MKKKPNTNRDPVNISPIIESKALFEEWSRYLKLTNPRYASWLKYTHKKPSIDDIIGAIKDSGDSIIGGLPEIKVIKNEK